MRSLKVRLIVFIALLLAITGFVITALVYSQMRGEIVRGVETELTSTSQGYATIVRDWYKSKLAIVLAAGPAVATPDAAPTLADLSGAASNMRQTFSRFHL